MSLKEKNSNDVYDVLGMSENFRKELIDNCFDKIDDMEYINVTDKENIDRNIIKWDSHNYENNKNKKQSIVKYSAAAVIVCACGLGLVVGANYFSKNTDDSYISTPLKNGVYETDSQLVETTKQVKKNSTAWDEYDDLEGTFENSNNTESLKESKGYYLDEKMFNGYEKRTYVLNTEDGEKEFSIVGKNFIEITPKEAATNAQNYLQKSMRLEYASDADTKTEILNEKSEFSKRIFLYYISGTDLCRAIIGEDRIDVWKDSEYAYDKLVKMDGKIYCVNNEDKEGNCEKYFYDVNVEKPMCIDLSNINDDKKHFLAYCYHYTKKQQGDKMIYYYIDTSWNLWRIEFTNKIDDMIDDELINSYVEDSHWGDCISGADINVDEIEKSHKLIAKNVDIYNEYDILSKKNTDKYVVGKKKNFEKVSEDDYVEYK